jgi:hypothetical protein
MKFKLLVLMFLFSSAAQAMHRPADIRLEMGEEPANMFFRKNKLDDCVQVGIHCCGKLMLQEPLDENEQKVVSRLQVAGAVGWGLGAAYFSCSGPAICLATGLGFVHGRWTAIVSGAFDECCDGKEKTE